MPDFRSIINTAGIAVSCMIMPGMAVVKDAASHTLSEYVPR